MSEREFTPEQICMLSHPAGCQCESPRVLRQRLAAVESVLAEERKRREVAEARADAANERCDLHFKTIDRVAAERDGERKRRDEAESLLEDWKANAPHPSVLDDLAAARARAEAAEARANNLDNRLHDAHYRADRAVLEVTDQRTRAEAAEATMKRVWRILFDIEGETPVDHMLAEDVEVTIQQFQSALRGVESEVARLTRELAAARREAGGDVVTCRASNASTRIFELVARLPERCYLKIASERNEDGTISDYAAIVEQAPEEGWKTRGEFFDQPDPSDRFSDAWRVSTTAREDLVERMLLGYLERVGEGRRRR